MKIKHQLKAILGLMLLVGLLTACDGNTSESILNIDYSVEQLALTPVARNEDWIPVEREINGVMMVLVPAGSFVMGSTQAQIDEAFAQCEESAITGKCDYTWFDAERMNGDNTQVFTAPFWIDKYEVTNKQFSDFGGVASKDSYWMWDDLPRESITWFEARDFCQLRGGRLPTEAEWEYVARGPNNLIYPWGNEFVGDNVVYSGNMNSRTAVVGSRIGGVSWVGAMDMSGNVWEWVSSLYQPYPYDEADESDIDSSNYRVIRGGSWGYTSGNMRASYRDRYSPDVASNYFGFRCVRTYP